MAGSSREWQGVAGSGRELAGVHLVKPPPPLYLNIPDSNLPYNIVLRNVN